MARGLGSSAAAIVAGLFAADHLYVAGALAGRSCGSRAVALEGHPDNVAAAIYGGFVICGVGDGDAAQRDPLRPRRVAWRAFAVVPAEEVSTERCPAAAIPAEVPLGDAVANVSAAALLVLGLKTGRP